jgi:hypothetical protein
MNCRHVSGFGFADLEARACHGLSWSSISSNQ